MSTREKEALLVAEKSIDLVCKLVGGAKGQTIIHETLSRVINQRAKAKIEGPAEAVDTFDELLGMAQDVSKAITS